MTAFALLAAILATAQGHQTRMVEVEPGVALEVLDWGGSGRPLVFLAGAGNTAHIFDEYALRFTDRYHVYGITRRGHGRSGDARAGLTMERLAEDVVAVLDSLRLAEPVLIGHSMGAQELMFVGRRHGTRVGAMVLLDSPYDLTVPELATWEDESMLLPRVRPAPGDLTSYQAFRTYRHRIDGYRVPEEEFRESRPANPDGTPGRRRQGLINMDEVWDSLGPVDFKSVTPPTLAIYALWEGPAETVFPQMAALDSAGQAAVRAFHARWTPGGRDEVRRRQMERAREMPRGEVVAIEGGKHYVFLSHPEETIRLISGFLRSRAP